MAYKNLVQGKPSSPDGHCVPAGTASRRDFVFLLSEAGFLSQGQSPTLLYGYAARGPRILLVPCKDVGIVTCTVRQDPKIDAIMRNLWPQLLVASASLSVQRNPAFKDVFVRASSTIIDGFGPGSRHFPQLGIRSSNNPAP